MVRLFMHHSSPKFLSTIFLIVIMILCFNCIIVPTNERTACKYKLDNNSTLVRNESCAFATGEFLIYTDSSSSPQQKQEALNFFNFFLLECAEYQERLKECNKEINKYIPTLHPQ